MEFKKIKGGKHQLADTPAPLQINKKVLDELNEIALYQNVPEVNEGNLSYREIQQVITLKALEKWTESFGIKFPFEINLKN